MTKRIHGPTILLVSGEYFNLLEPETSHFTILDIAHGLSNLCRFAGQCRSFYSVAEHSVHCSRYVAPEHALAALLHDASEAFVGDVTRPLKALLSEYRAIEQRIEDVICERFGLPFPMNSAVKAIDSRLLITEQRQLMRSADDWETWSASDSARAQVADIEPLPVTLPCWAPEVAKERFLARYEELAHRSFLAADQVSA